MLNISYVVLRLRKLQYMEPCCCINDEVSKYKRILNIFRNKFVQLIHICFRCIALYSPNKGFTRRYIKILIGFAWIAAFLPLIPSFFGFYGDHGLECQTRQCKILSDGEHGHVKRRFELFLHVCWAVLLVAANVGLFLRYWV